MSPRISPISPGIAKRIDRLSRGAHAFHRFAHHPLCREYAGEVFRIGRRVRLCRGCTLAAVGALAGIVAALAAHPGPIAAASATAIALVLLPGHLRPLGKVATRLLPAGLLAFSIASGAIGAGLGVSVAVLAVALYRRRGPDRAPCRVCPERSRPEPCRGYAAIVRRERAFERATDAWLQPSRPAQT